MRYSPDFDARAVGLRMSDNLSREELYDRDAELERRLRKNARAARLPSHDAVC